VATRRSFRGLIIEKPGPSIERTVYDSEFSSASFNTAVGNVLSIEGRLVLSGEGFAGRSGFLFFPEFQASVNVSRSGLWFTAPPGIGIDAPSGHDYTVPEPESVLLFAASAATLLGLRALRTAAARR